jgi:NADH:ubiquinone oxidoreductase subunit 6 (subunit J)
MKKSRNQFSYRSFISLLMAACFLGLVVSGIILYIAPPCSLAASINWSALSLSKVQWSSLHQVLALFILILALFHLFVFNWKSFTLYFKRNRIRRKTAGAGETGQSFFTKFRLPREVVAAIIGAIILYIGAILMISPFGWLHEGNDAIKDHYRQEYPDRQGRGMGIGERQDLHILQSELFTEQPDTIFTEILPDSEFE